MKRSSIFLFGLFTMISSAILFGCPADGGGARDASMDIDAGDDVVVDSGMTMVDAGNPIDGGMPLVDGGPGEPFPDGLECPSISFCSTYEANPVRVPFPEDDEVGGVIQDGIYRAVEGTNMPFIMVFDGDKFSTLFDNLVVSHGTWETEGDVLRRFRDTACDFDSFEDGSLVYIEIEQFYATDGDELITYSGCGSAIPDECNSPTRLLRVDSPCSDLDQLICPAGQTCVCEDFKDVIPERPADGSCVFN